MGAGLALPAVTMSEAQAYVRIETGEEEAVLAALIRTASAVCEEFLNRVVVARDFELDVPPSGSWERVPLTPVRTIASVEAVDTTGVAEAPAWLRRRTRYPSRSARASCGWSRICSRRATARAGIRPRRSPRFGARTGD